MNDGTSILKALPPQTNIKNLAMLDGVYFRPRMAAEKQYVLILFGANEWGRKEIIGLADDYREMVLSRFSSGLLAAFMQAFVRRPKGFAPQ